MRLSNKTNEVLETTLVSNQAEEEQGPQTVYVSLKHELTQEVRDAIKSHFGTRVKKVDLMGHTFVFLCLNRKEWEERIEDWMLNFRGELTKEERDKKLVESAVVFPDMSLNFDNHPAKAMVYWNNLPAGIQPRLAQLIEHNAGFLVPGLATESDFYYEDLFQDENAESNKPSTERLAQLKTLTEMPLRLCKLNNNWWVIRGMTFTEAKITRKLAIENPNAEHEMVLLKKCILEGPTNFNDLPAGVVPFLTMNLRQASGLALDDEPLLNSEVEDL